MFKDIGNRSGFYILTVDLNWAVPYPIKKGTSVVIRDNFSDNPVEIIDSNYNFSYCDKKYLIKIEED